MCSVLFLLGHMFFGKNIGRENVILFLFDGMHNLLLDIINIVGGVVLRNLKTALANKSFVQHCVDALYSKGRCIV